LYQCKPITENLRILLLKHSLSILPVNWI
jgi:hypothetical protein